MPGTYSGDHAQYTYGRSCLVHISTINDNFGSAQSARFGGTLRGCAIRAPPRTLCFSPICTVRGHPQGVCYSSTGGLWLDVLAQFVFA